MTTRDGCRRMLDAAKEHRAEVVVINHELRYSKFFQKIKDLIAGGEVGEVQLVWCKEFRGPFLKKVGDWIQDARYSGGAWSTRTATTLTCELVGRLRGRERSAASAGTTSSAWSTTSTK
jgi:predicted dehydrogenase